MAIFRVCEKQDKSKTYYKTYDTKTHDLSVLWNDRQGQEGRWQDIDLSVPPDLNLRRRKLAPYNLALPLKSKNARLTLAFVASSIDNRFVWKPVWKPSGTTLYCRIVIMDNQNNETIVTLDSNGWPFVYNGTEEQELSEEETKKVDCVLLNQALVAIGKVNEVYEAIRRKA